MTQEVANRAFGIMQKINSHPCSKTFLDSPQEINLSVISEKLITDEYETVGEWRKDVRSVVSKVESVHGKDSIMAKLAGQMFCLFEKEYLQFVEYSTRKWSQRVGLLLSKIEELYANIPPGIEAFGDVGYGLWRSKCTISSLSQQQSRMQAMQAASRPRSIPQPILPQLHPAKSGFRRPTPFEPVWRNVCTQPALHLTHLSAPNGTIEPYYFASLGQNMFYDPLRIFYGEDFSDETELDDESSPETTQPHSPAHSVRLSHDSPAAPQTGGKAPRQLQGTAGKSPSSTSGRIQIRCSSSQVSPIAPESPLDSSRSRTPPSPRARGRPAKPRGGTTRRRRRRQFDSDSDSSDSDEDEYGTSSAMSPQDIFKYIPSPGSVPDVTSISDEDKLWFVQAASSITSLSDALVMAQIIAEYDPTVDLTDSMPEIDIEHLNPQALYLLIQFMRSRK